MHFARSISNAGSRFSGNAIDAMCNICPYEAQATTNRVGFLTRIMNQRYGTLGGRAYSEAVKISLIIGKGWLNETLRYMDVHNIDTQILKDDNISPMLPRTDNKDMAYYKSKKVSKDETIPNKTHNNWKEKLKSTIRIETCEDEDGITKYTWCINEIRNRYFEKYAEHNEYDDGTWKTIIHEKENIIKDGRKIPIIPCTKFMENIRSQTKRNQMNLQFMGAWKFGRIMAGNGIVFINNLKDIDGKQHNDFTWRRKCPACWIEHDQITIEDENHVLFSCPKYQHITEEAMKRISIDGMEQSEDDFERIFWDTTLHNNKDDKQKTVNDKYNDTANHIADACTRIRYCRTMWLEKQEKNRNKEEKNVDDKNTKNKT